MTDQTPASEQPHPLATMGIQLQAEISNAAVSHDFAALMDSLPDATMTFDGTFTDSTLLQSLLPTGPVLRDFAFTPDPEDRPPCPHCATPAEQIDYQGAEVSSMDTSEQDGMTTFAMHVTRCESAAYKPCGHRFDGTTGELLPDDTA